MQNSRPHRSLYCILVGIQRGRSWLSTGAGRKEGCHVRRYERLRLRPSTTTSALSRGTCPSAVILGRPNATSGAPNGQGVCARCCSTPPILEKARHSRSCTAALSNPPPPSPLGAPLVAFGAAKTPYSEQVTWGRVVGGQAGVTRRYATAQVGHLRAV